LSIIPVNLTFKKLKLFLKYAFLLLVRIFNIGKNRNQNTLFQESNHNVLGLNRELAYIRNGVVSTNAVNFDIPVSSDLDSVHFLWSNPDPSLPVNYKLVIKLDAGNDPEVGDDSANGDEPMHQPFVNISHSGKFSICYLAF
jgi:hypothetical protein